MHLDQRLLEGLVRWNALFFVMSSHDLVSNTMCYLFQTTQRSEPQRVGQIQSQQKTGQILDQPVRQIMDQPGRQIMDQPVRQIMDQNIEQQTVRQILEKLGSGLHETELWALCAECVLALQQSSTQALREY